MKTKFVQHVSRINISMSQTHTDTATLHSGVASGHRNFWAIGEFIYGLLELEPALSPDLKTVFGLNFNEVEQENGSF